MPKKGNPSAAAKKPSYASNCTLPKGSNWGFEDRGQIPHQPVSLNVKEFSRTKQTQEGKE